MGKFISCGEFDKNYICLYIGSLLVYLGSILSYILGGIYIIDSKILSRRKNKLIYIGTTFILLWTIFIYYLSISNEQKSRK